MTNQEFAPQTKIEKLVSEIRIFLLENLDCKEVKIKKEKFMPELSIKIIFENKEFGEVATSVFLDLEGENQDEFIILAMTTLPDPAKGSGYGSKVIKTICSFLKERKDLKFIRAVQVSNPRSKKFWIGCGFVELGNVTGDFQFENK